MQELLLTDPAAERVDTIEQQYAFLLATGLDDPEAQWQACVREVGAGIIKRIYKDEKVKARRGKAPAAVDTTRERLKKLKEMEIITEEMELQFELARLY